jgi:hypothetical protein
MELFALGTEYFTKSNGHESTVMYAFVAGLFFHYYINGMV